MGQTVVHSVLVNIDDLTPEQAVRFWHHVEISRRVFEASVHSMIKGVRKYGPEPDDYLGHPPSQAQFWLPHIFQRGGGRCQPDGAVRRCPGGGAKSGE